MDATPGRNPMAKKSKLTKVAASIGGALGKADRKAHKIVQAGSLAKEELRAISKQVDALKRQLEKTARRLQNAVR
jgi:seryl-tRNA synthetase